MYSKGLQVKKNHTLCSSRNICVCYSQ